MKWKFLKESWSGWWRHLGATLVPATKTFWSAICCGAHERLENQIVSACLLFFSCQNSSLLASTLPPILQLFTPRQVISRSGTKSCLSYEEGPETGLNVDQGSNQNKKIKTTFQNYSLKECVHWSNDNQKIHHVFGAHFLVSAHHLFLRWAFFPSIWVVIRWGEKVTEYLSPIHFHFDSRSLSPFP